MSKEATMRTPGGVRFRAAVARAASGRVPGSDAAKHRAVRDASAVASVATALAFATGLAGCEEFMAQRQQARAEQEQRESGMQLAAHMPDGHQYLDGSNSGLFTSIQSLPPGTPWKSCTPMKRYLLEPGEPTGVSYDANFKGYVQPLIDQGKLPRDLYYAAAGSSQFIVSVPASDRVALAKNMEAGDVCIWSSGTFQKFPCPGNTPGCAVYYAPLEKWDGVLGHPGAAPGPGGPEPGAPAAPGSAAPPSPATGEPTG